MKNRNYSNQHHIKTVWNPIANTSNNFNEQTYETYSQTRMCSVLGSVALFVRFCFGAIFLGSFGSHWLIYNPVVVNS